MPVSMALVGQAPGTAVGKALGGNKEKINHWKQQYPSFDGYRNTFLNILQSLLSELYFVTFVRVL